eukprot:gene4706-21000_t
MLIYPNQTGLCSRDQDDNKSTMGLSTDSNSLAPKSNSNTSYGEQIYHMEDMHKKEEKADPAKTLELLHNPHMWNYDDFSFEQIGEGFFGNVYKVTHKLTSQVLVLKELKNTTDEDHKTMFSEEIKAMHRLCHPNVLKCEGLAWHKNSLCLLTEYITGGSLDDLLTKKSPLLSTWQAKLSVALEIARGMHYLHSQGVIHRDLASKNILIRQKDDFGLQAIVADLGLSRTVAGLALSEDEYFFEIVGSPYHMAPEVLNDKPYNMKADVFSYGIMLCEMITMCPGADPDDVPRSDDFGLAVENFTEVAADCPSKFLDLTIRCCQMNPKERPSFQNIVKALDIILDKFIENDEEAQIEDKTSFDYVIDASLMCTCRSFEKGEVIDDTLGVENFKDRFGSVRMRASRRVIKSKLARCPHCGGRILKGQGIGTEDEKGSEVESEKGTSIQAVVPLKNEDSASSPRNEFITGALLNESQGTLELSQLVDNTPGKLPRFFKNLLKSKRGKIRSKDVKRRWRKSLHDLFSPNSSHTEAALKAEQVGCENDDVASVPAGMGVSPTRTDKSDKGEKQDKPEKHRKLSKFRRKSEHKTQIDLRKMSYSNDDFDSGPSASSSTVSSPRSPSAVEDVDSGTVTDENTKTLARSFPLQSHVPQEASFARALAVSVDSLDKLGIGESTEKPRDRRYSMPSRKMRHGRTRSVESPHPPLQKKTSSSKLLSFLKRKSSGNLREQKL